MKGAGEDFAPTLPGRQLLRICDQPPQESGYRSKRLCGGNGLGVRAGDLDRRLSRMAHPLGDGVQQQRSARDRLSVTIRLGQAREDVPPIIKQRHEAGRQTTARQVMSDEAAPAPLVLQLVENILSIAAVAIELAKAFQSLDAHRPGAL